MRRSWNLFLFFLLIAVILVANSYVAAYQDPTKPDIHLSFQIKEDGSNTTSIEIAVSPLIDPLIKQAMQYAAHAFKDNGNSKSQSSTYELTTTTRAGREYHALLIHYNSLGDLNAFINTPQMLSGFFGSLLPGGSIPRLFSSFSVITEKEDGGEVYKFTAVIEPDVTSRLAFANVTIHVHLPGKIISHNASFDEDGDLMWIMKDGSPLNITVVSRKSSHLGGILEIPSNRNVFLWGGGLILLVLAFVVILLLMRRKSSDLDDGDDEDVWYEY